MLEKLLNKVLGKPANDASRWSDRGFPGLASGLASYEMGTPTGHEILSTGVSGRYLFRQKSCLVQILCHERIQLGPEGKSSLPPLAVELSAGRSQLTALNLACGGPCDIPFIDGLLRERGDVPPVKWCNLDKSRTVVELVQKNQYPYRLWEDTIRRDTLPVGAELAASLRSFRETYLREEGNIDPLQVRGRATPCYTFSDPAHIPDIAQGDAGNLSAVASGSVDLAVCFNLAAYLSTAEKSRVVNEVSRVLREGGAFISDGMVAQKQAGTLQWCSGIEVITENELRLSHGMYATPGPGVDHAPLALARADWNPFTRSLILADPVSAWAFLPPPRLDWF